MIRFWARMFHAHLIEEIGYLRGQLEHERARAEMAIDTLLNVRVGVAPVTIQTPAEIQAREEVDPIARLLRNTEYMEVGEVDPK